MTSLPSATFDGPTVRAVAVAAFHAEQRRRSSTSRAPDAVMAFAASTGFRRPTTAHLSAVPDRDLFADTHARPHAAGVLDCGHA